MLQTVQSYQSGRFVIEGQIFAVAQQFLMVTSLITIKCMLQYVRTWLHQVILQTIMKKFRDLKIPSAYFLPSVCYQLRIVGYRSMFCAQRNQSPSQSFSQLVALKKSQTPHTTGTCHVTDHSPLCFNPACSCSIPTLLSSFPLQQLPSSRQ